MGVNIVGKVSGTVIELKNKGLNFPSIAKVEYEVNGKKYQIEETIKLVSKVIKLGFLPIGQKKTSKINCEEGSVVTIVYDEEHPEKAYIEGNGGIINC